MRVLDTLLRLVGPDRRRRVPAALFLALQTLSPVVLPIADARLEAAALLEAAHIEAESDGGCTPAHSDFTCQICRTMAAPIEPPTPAEFGLPLSRSTGHVVAAQPAVLRPGCPTLLGSRAPPAAT
jgi:hypothetical protein